MGTHVDKEVFRKEVFGAKNAGKILFIGFVRKMTVASFLNSSH